MTLIEFYRTRRHVKGQETLAYIYTSDYARYHIMQGSDEFPLEQEASEWDDSYDSWLRLRMLGDKLLRQLAGDYAGTPRVKVCV